MITTIAPKAGSASGGAGGAVHVGVPTRAPQGGRVRVPQLNPAAQVGGPLEDTTFLLRLRDEQQLLDEQILLRSSFQNGLDPAQIRSTLVASGDGSLALLAGADTTMGVPLDGIMPLDQWTIEFALLSPGADLFSVTNKAVFAIISKSQQLVVIAAGGQLQANLTLFAGPDRATDTVFPGAVVLASGDVPADTWTRFAIAFNNTGPSLRVIRGANLSSLNSTVTGGAPWGSGIVAPWAGNLFGGAGGALFIGAQSSTGTFGGLRVKDLRISRNLRTYGAAIMVKPATLSIDASTAQGAWPTGVAGVVEQYTGLSTPTDLDATVRDIQLGALRDAGCKMIRVSDIESLAVVTAVTPLTIDYSLMDARYDRYTGMDFNLTLCYCPQPLRAVSGDAHGLPSDNTKLAAYYSAVVSHIKARYPGRLKSIAFWNEPPGFLTGTQAAFLATELAVAQKMNTDHPDIPMGGTDQAWDHDDVSTTSGTGYQKAIIDQRAANALPLGALFLHDYSGDQDYLRRAIKSIRAYAVTKGFSAATPVRVTEWSYTISASAQSAAPYSPASINQFHNRADMAAFAHMYMARMIAEGVDIAGLLRIGGIHDSIIPPGGGIEDVFGLFDNTGRPWPVWATFVLMLKHAGNKVATSGNGYPGLRALASKATDGRIMTTYSSYRPWKPNARRRFNLEWTGLPTAFTWQQWAMDRTLDSDGRPALTGSGNQDNVPLTVDIAACGVGGIEIVPA